MKHIKKPYDHVSPQNSKDWFYEDFCGNEPHVGEFFTLHLRGRTADGKSVLNGNSTLCRVKDLERVIKLDFDTGEPWECEDRVKVVFEDARELKTRQTGG